MVNPYNLSLTASQIDAALLAASDSDNNPNSGDTNLVNSNRIYNFVTGLVSTETSTRAAADTALSDRIDPLEKEVLLSTVAGGNTGASTHIFSGYTIPTGENVTLSEPSTGVLRISGTGVYRITWSACFYDSDRGVDTYTLYLYVNSTLKLGRTLDNVGFSITKKEPVSYSILVDLGATSEVDIEVSLEETQPNTVIYWEGFTVLLEEIA